MCSPHSPSGTSSSWRPTMGLGFGSTGNCYSTTLTRYDSRFVCYFPETVQVATPILAFEDTKCCCHTVHFHRKCQQVKRFCLGKWLLLTARNENPEKPLCLKAKTRFVLRPPECSRSLPYSSHSRCVHLWEKCVTSSCRLFYSYREQLLIQSAQSALQYPTALFAVVRMLPSRPVMQVLIQPSE